MTGLSSPHLPEVSESAAAGAFDALLAMVERSRRLVVLSGAGCSTESGIPDYRDSNGAWKRTPPMQYQEFVGSTAARQRYWARALIGWRQFRELVPNAAHRALVRLERAGRVACLITQNVDGLHQRAGSRGVIDLHGRIDSVDCLQCRMSFPRGAIQLQFEQLNPGWSGLEAAMAPDGDAVPADVDFSHFRLLSCEHCGGQLKPAVVFFGEKVPEQRVQQAFSAVVRADALLVVGSSLMVYSGYRFVRAACERGIPVAIINIGKTRADAQVTIKLEGKCGAVLEQLEARLSAFSSPSGAVN